MLFFVIIFASIVYVTVAFGNSGSGGLQTGDYQAISTGALAVGSADNMNTVQPYIIGPDDKKIFYFRNKVSGWASIMNSTIVVNGSSVFFSIYLINFLYDLDPNRRVNDGCSGPAKPVSGFVVLFFYSPEDTCYDATRCDLAADAGAIGCLVSNYHNYQLFEGFMVFLCFSILK